MQVEITCRHGEITPDVHDYIAGKSQKLLTFFQRITAIKITVEFEKDRTQLDIQVDAEHKNNFVAHDVGDDVISAFDRTFQKMEQQLRKYKEKIQDHRRDRPVNEIEGTENQPEENEL